jgi:lipoate-protein ligase B
VPCGIADGTVTSLRQELGREFDLAEVKRVLAVEFWALLPAFFTEGNEGRERVADQNPAG